MTFRPIRRRAVLGGLLVLPSLLLPAPAAARPNPQGMVAVRSPEGEDWVRLSALFGVFADVGSGQPPGQHSGLAVGDARLRLSGDLGHGFGYVMQSDLARDHTLLDLVVEARLGAGLRVRAGRFKMPFSGEQLISAARIDLVDRARVVRALAPGRDVGVELSGSAAAVDWALAASNGTGSSGNDSDDLLWTARVAVDGEGPGGHWTAGVNGALSEDRAASLGRGLPAAFDGSRRLAGGDARWTAGPWLLSGEYLWGRLDPRGGPDAEVRGFHLTGGYTFDPRVQGLLRYDSYEPDAGLDVDGRWLLASLAVDAPPPTPVYFQLEYRLDLEDTGHHRILATADVAF